MADCRYLKKCPFFNGKMPSMPAMAELYKKMYCRSEFRKCARFIVREKAGAEEVPLNLFPCQMERVDSSIRKVKSS